MSALPDRVRSIDSLQAALNPDEPARRPTSDPLCTSLPGATPRRLLLLQGDAPDAGLLRALSADLMQSKFVLSPVTRLADALARLKSGQFDVILSELDLPDSSGLATLRAISASAPTLPVVVLIGPLQDELGAAALRAGAQDYLPRGERNGLRIQHTLCSAVERMQLKRELTELCATLEQRVAQRTAELEQTASALRESEARYQALTRLSSDWYWEQDENLRFTRISTSNASQLSFSAETYLGHTRREMLEAIGYDLELQALEDITARRQAFRDFEIGRTNKRDGAMRYARISGEPVFDAAGVFKGYRGVGTDITERHAAEVRIRRLSRLYAALSHCNQAVARCGSEQEVYAQVCEAAVKFGDMKMAWISLVDPLSHALKFRASAGAEVSDYLSEVEISVDADSPLGQGALGRAYRSGEPHWIQNFLNDPATQPWHALGRRFGLGSVAALPLRRAGVVVGVLSLVAQGVDAFDAEMRQLLVDMAADISVALDNLARGAERERVLKDLHAAEEQFRSLVEHSLTGIYIVKKGVFQYANPRLEQMLGYGRGELVGVPVAQVVYDEDLPMLAQSSERSREGAPVYSVESRARRRDGSVFALGVQGSHYVDKGESVTIGMAQDISDKKAAEQQAQQHVEQLRATFMRTVEMATALSELRDPYTSGHAYRVGMIASALGAELGLDDNALEGLRVGGYLHDIGKITVPAEILSKPGKLSAVELQLIRQHAQAGFEVLKEVGLPWPVAQIALMHHERMDGSGYPNGVAGEQIPLEARIMSVADVIEAMWSHRPYRPGLGIDAALAEVERGAGVIYDADVAAAALRLFRLHGYRIPTEDRPMRFRG